MCPMLGDEDEEDIKTAEADYEELRAKGERMAKEIAMKKQWTN